MISDRNNTGTIRAKHNSVSRVSVVMLCMLMLVFALCFCGCSETGTDDSASELEGLTELEYEGRAAVEVNGGMPYFSEDEYEEESYDRYFRLDRYGRCTGAMACLGADLMPTEERGDISSVKPSGWQTSEYSFIDQGKLYNRCHLIAFMLTGQNANERNLITGTRYMNTRGMLPYEIEVADYVMTTGNHVLYRVRPVYEGTDEVASGVLMEAFSVEDRGRGICFNVYCFNVQPGVVIDYSDGSNHRDENAASLESEGGKKYVLNTNTHRIHAPDCPSVSDISDYNRQDVTADIDTLIAAGYSRCGNCNAE